MTRLGGRNRIDKKWRIRYKGGSHKIYYQIGNIVVSHIYPSITTKAVNPHPGS